MKNSHEQTQVESTAISSGRFMMMFALRPAKRQFGAYSSSLAASEGMYLLEAHPKSIVGKIRSTNCIPFIPYNILRKIMSINN